MRPTAAAVSLSALLLLAVVAHGAPTTQKSPATGPSAKKATSKLAYKLGEGSEKWDAEKRERVVNAMDSAVAIYDENGKPGEFEKTLTAYYNPGTPTADGNYNGTIRFGGQIGTRVALHEMAHTLGVGQHRKWNELIKDGKWTGEHAIKQLREFDGPDAVLHADRQHFWPYGLNQDREGGTENFKRHVRMVAAIRRDLGIIK